MMQLALSEDAERSKEPPAQVRSGYSDQPARSAGKSGRMPVTTERLKQAMEDRQMDTEKLFKCNNCGEPAATRWVGFSALRDDGALFELCWKCATGLSRSEKLELMRNFGANSTLSNDRVRGTDE